MRIAVIDGTELIGPKTVGTLCQKGHDVVAASPNSGVDTITGEDLASRTFFQQQKFPKMIKRLLCTAALAFTSVASVPSRAASPESSAVNLVYEHVLPNVPGKSIKSVLVEHQPGGSSPSHTHPNSAFIYATVLTGAIRSQVNNGPVTTYRAGESFSEMPGDRHAVSENASTTEPARLLAVFIVDTSETVLTTESIR